MFSDRGDLASKGLLAYEAAVPEKGGAVLLADGTITTMTAAEFAAAPKPPPPAPAAKK